MGNFILGQLNAAELRSTEPTVIGNKAQPSMTLSCFPAHMFGNRPSKRRITFLCIREPSRNFDNQTHWGLVKRALLLVEHANKVTCIPFV